MDRVVYLVKEENGVFRVSTEAGVKLELSPWREHSGWGELKAIHPRATDQRVVELKGAIRRFPGLNRLRLKDRYNQEVGSISAYCLFADDDWTNTLALLAEWLDTETASILQPMVP